MVFIVNRITVLESPEEYERIYAEAGEFMESQDGLVHHQLIRSRSQPDVYFSVAEWVDMESFERCASQSEFRRIFDQTKGMVEIDHHLGDSAVRGGPESPQDR